MTATPEIAAAKPNLMIRSDTMLGICQGLGDDFGFNPDFLRVALGVVLVWKPWLAIGAYLAIGVVVLASRLLFPSKVRAAVEGVGTDNVSTQAMQSANDEGVVAQAA